MPTGQETPSFEFTSQTHHTSLRAGAKRGPRSKSVRTLRLDWPCDQLATPNSISACRMRGQECLPTG